MCVCHMYSSVAGDHVVAHSCGSYTSLEKAYMCRSCTWAHKIMRSWTIVSRLEVWWSGPAQNMQTPSVWTTQQWRLLFFYHAYQDLVYSAKYWEYVVGICIIAIEKGKNFFWRHRQAQTKALDASSQSMSHTILLYYHYTSQKIQ